ncbi:MAG: M30 family zinc metallopeptidase [Spirochaetota bacterium]
MRAPNDPQPRAFARMLAVYVLSAAVLALASCGPFPHEIEPDSYSPGSDNVFHYDLDDVEPDQEILYSVNVGDDPKDVYLIFTNPTTGAVSAPTVERRSEVGTIEPPSFRSTIGSRAAGAPNDPPALRDRPDLLGWEPPRPNGSRSLLAAEYTPDGTNPAPPPDEFGTSYDLYDQPPGDTFDFYDYIPSSDEIVAIPSVLAYRSATPVETSPGEKTLEIWVEESEWSSDDSSPLVSPAKTAALAERFLETGADNDIYDWVSAVYGEEWSALDDDNIYADDAVPEQDTITILLYDIEDDPSAGDGPGGIVGFFWSKDNFVRVQDPLNPELKTSNERIMFYLDSETFRATLSGEGSWDITDYWPSQIVSTLAHELQHMIGFHERTVLRGSAFPVWLEELMSLASEDLVEWKRNDDAPYAGPGPRGVPVPPDYADYAIGDAGPEEIGQGRLPDYNDWNDISLTRFGATDDILRSYAVSYAFGAYLGRNYGGAGLFETLAHSTSSSTSTILAAATDRTLDELLWRWGAAVLLSDDEGANEHELNRGEWFPSAAGEIDYRLGSINHFNYDPQPYVHTDLNAVDEMPAGSKLFYLVSRGLTGTVDLEMDVPRGIDLTVVVK